MNEWIVFQLVFDIILFAFIIYLVVGQAKAKKNAPKLADLQSLVHEFRDAVEKSERIAKDLDIQLASRRDMLAVSTSHSPPSTPRMTTSANPAGATPVVKEAIGKNDGKPDKGSPSLDAIQGHKRMVSELFRQGLTKEEISRKLSIPLPEVDLIVTMLMAND